MRLPHKNCNDFDIVGIYFKGFSEDYLLPLDLNITRVHHLNINYEFDPLIIYCCWGRTGNHRWVSQLQTLDDLRAGRDLAHHYKAAAARRKFLSCALVNFPFPGNCLT